MKLMSVNLMNVLMQVQNVLVCQFCIYVGMYLNALQIMNTQRCVNFVQVIHWPKLIYDIQFVIGFT